MEIKNRGRNILQTTREELLDATETLWNNEVKANIFVAKIMIGTAATLVLIIALTLGGVFSINSRLTTMMLITSAIQFAAAGVIALFLKGEKKWLKTVLMIIYSLMLARLHMVLGHNVVLLLAFPIVLSVRYYSVFLTRFVAFFSMALYIIASYFGVAKGNGRLDLNMVELPEGTVLTVPSTGWLRDTFDPAILDHVLLWRHFIQHSFLPKLILYIMVSLLCINLARRGRQAILEQKAETEKTERLSTELSLASGIQSAMLPNIFPAFPEREEFDIYAYMEPAKEVGGDFYDFYMIDDDHLAMLIADVSGKGIPAAMFMMASKIIINNVSKLGSSDPGRILEISNRQISENNPAEMFVTVWLGILNIRTGVMTAANAGHEYPCVQHAGGDFEIKKEKHGMVLGAFENSKYNTYEIKMEQGDAIFVYTDGVAEANDSEHNLFGMDRLIETLNADRNADAETMIRNVNEAIDGFVKDAPQFDDTTMMSLRYLG